MKYKEFKPEKETVYKWVITDDEYGEFLQCHRCKSESPISLFEDYITGGIPLCDICANATQDNANVANALNVAIRVMGGFDEYEVVSIEDSDFVAYYND